jgi:hypothetical protein
VNIKIGGTTYPVIDRDDLHDKHKQLFGWIKFDTSEIILDTELGPQARYTVLWHEIIHGILTNAGIEDQEERIVMALGHGIVQVLRDNPVLLTLLAETHPTEA